MFNQFRRRCTFLAGASIAWTTFCVAQSVSTPLPADRLEGSASAEVFILGTYHMDNPGRDIINMKADDVLSPKRQAEMRELLDALLRFRPTKIVIEAPPDSPKIKLYEDYVAGTHELSRDEREQIGFRLAKELNHPRVYGIDEPGDFPFASVQDYAKAHGREKELESLMGKVGKMVQEDNDFLTSHSILQMLLRTNSAEAVRRDLSGYAMFAHYGEEDDYAGAELLTHWYRRNMRIHTNLLQLLTPGDRVLVVYGSGHLGLLRQNVQADTMLKLRTLDEFVAQQK